MSTFAIGIYFVRHVIISRIAIIKVIVIRIPSACSNSCSYYSHIVGKTKQQTGRIGNGKRISYGVGQCQRIDKLAVIILRRDSSYPYISILLCHGNGIIQ